MAKLLILLLLPLILFAGRTSQWSGSFLLKDPAFNTRTEDPIDPVGPFAMAARPNPFNPATTIFVSGILPRFQSSLYIYNIDGKRIADLSSLIHTGYSSITWNAPSASSGLLFAVLQNGNRTKTIKLVLLK